MRMHKRINHSFSHVSDLHLSIISIVLFWQLPYISYFGEWRTKIHWCEGVLLIFLCNFEVFVPGKIFIRLFTSWDNLNPYFRNTTRISPQEKSAYAYPLDAALCFEPHSFPLLDGFHPETHLGQWARAPLNSRLRGPRAKFRKTSELLSISFFRLNWVVISSESTVASLSDNMWSASKMTVNYCCLKHRSVINCVYISNALLSWLFIHLSNFSLSNYLVDITCL